jgi:hypothetical protein
MEDLNANRRALLTGLGGGMSIAALASIARAGSTPEGAGGSPPASGGKTYAQAWREYLDALEESRATIEADPACADPRVRGAPSAHAIAGGGLLHASGAAHGPPADEPASHE